MRSLIKFSLVQDVKKRKKIQSQLQVLVKGPREAIEALPGVRRTASDVDEFRLALDCEVFAWSIDGLAEPLVWARDVANRVHSEDFCERCRVDGRDPVKKLRARPLP